MPQQVSGGFRTRHRRSGRFCRPLPEAVPLPRQVVPGLTSQPRICRAPSNRFQLKGQRHRDARSPVEHTGKRDTRHADPARRLAHRQVAFPQWILHAAMSDVPSGMRRVAPQPSVVRHAALALAHDSLLMVVGQSNIQHVVAFDAEHDPPHARHCHRQLPLADSVQEVQPVERFG